MKLNKYTLEILTLIILSTVLASMLLAILVFMLLLKLKVVCCFYYTPAQPLPVVSPRPRINRRRCNTNGATRKYPFEADSTTLR